MVNGKQVLIVDDDQVVLDLYKERFIKEGLNAEICLDGETALRKIHEQLPDVILLDIMMPKFNGYDLLTSLKSDPKTKDIPVIILTALMRDINKTRALAAGADDYIVKSEAMPEEVIKKIQAVLIKQNDDHVKLAKQEIASNKLPEQDIPKSPDISDVINFEPAQNKQEEVSKPAIPPVKPLPNLKKITQPPKITSTGFIVPAKPVQSVQIPTKVNNPPANTPRPPAKKLSGVIIFCLILIIILIIISDVFFYIMLISQ